jgi:hypothetical protein
MGKAGCTPARPQVQPTAQKSSASLYSLLSAPSGLVALAGGAGWVGAQQAQRHRGEGLGCLPVSGAWPLSRGHAQHRYLANICSQSGCGGRTCLYMSPASSQQVVMSPGGLPRGPLSRPGGCAAPTADAIGGPYSKRGCYKVISYIYSL